MPGKSFNVAVIILNYNSSAYTLDCVASILEKTNASLGVQIIVIDNNSRDDEFEKLNGLSGKSSDITVFRSRLNTGFSGGNMMGVQFANAEYYYFLNNDTVLRNDCLSILYAFCESHPQAGICSGQMHNDDDSQACTFQYFPSALLLVGTSPLRLLNPEKYPSKKIHYTQPLKVDVISGSSMFIRATAFDGIGGFDTNYFLYCEEEDIAFRMRAAGFNAYLVPDAKYTHFTSKSVVKSNGLNLPYLREYYISYFYYCRKNLGWFSKNMIRVVLIIKNLLKGFRHTDHWKLAWFLLRGAHVRHSLRFRQVIRS